MAEKYRASVSDRLRDEAKEAKIPKLLLLYVIPETCVHISTAPQLIVPFSGNKRWDLTGPIERRAFVR